MYDKQKIGQGLKEQLDIGYDIVRISRWAFGIYSNNRAVLTEDEEEILEYLFFMEDDPQFEYSENELLFLANNLIKNVPDALKKTNDLKNIDLEGNKSE
jgi:hypothetical protein